MSPHATPFSGRLALLFVASFLAVGNFAALMSVVPLWASEGGASGSGIGATTGSMLAATVATQLNMVWLFRFFSLRRMIVLGTLVLGLATPAYALTDALVPIVMISAVRGIGFAFVVVAGVALAAELAPRGKVATATGMYGVAAGLPNVLMLPAGVWLAQTWGFTPVFLTAAAMAVTAAPLALLLPERDGHDRRTTAPRRRIDRRALAGAGVFLVTAATLGTLTTFLPIAIPASPVPSLALFVLSVAMVLARVMSGTFGDRYGTGRLLVPAALTCAVGCAVMAATVADGGAVLLLGATVFGFGFGAAQNDSFVVVLRHLGPGRSGTASTIWNIAYDGGMGVGPFVVGLGLTLTGYPGAFAALAVALLLAAVVGHLVGGPWMGLKNREQS